jgi:hypothetical protein
MARGSDGSTIMGKGSRSDSASFKNLSDLNAFRLF